MSVSTNKLGDGCDIKSSSERMKESSSERNKRSSSERNE